jgi:hypothetical protein
VLWFIQLSVNLTERHNKLTQIVIIAFNVDITVACFRLIWVNLNVATVPVLKCNRVCVSIISVLIITDPSTVTGPFSELNACSAHPPTQLPQSPF